MEKKKLRYVERCSDTEMRGVPVPGDFSRVITVRMNVLIIGASDNATDELELHFCLIMKKYNKENHIISTSWYRKGTGDSSRV